MSEYVPQHGGNRAPNRPASGNKKNNKLLFYVCLGIAIVVFVVAAVLFIKGTMGGSSQTGGQGIQGDASSDNAALQVFIKELEGKWKVDEITSYEFDGAGKGVMHTAIDDYDFTYTADGFKLNIDFVSPDGEDSQYNYTLSGDQLVFTRWGVDYPMTKVAG